MDWSRFFDCLIFFFTSNRSIRTARERLHSPIIWYFEMEIVAGTSESKSFIFSWTNLLAPRDLCFGIIFQILVETMADQAGDEYAKPLFVNGRYENPFPTWKQPGFFNLCKYFLYDTNESSIRSQEDLDTNLPVLQPDFKDFDSSPPDIMCVIWLGHSSLLVKFDGVTILTDPIFSKRCSPFQFIGPKRFRDAPCQISDLPPIDIVIISHNHYDHMDYETIVNLQKKYKSSLTWFVPMGDKRWMEASGCTNVREMTWWQEEILADHIGIKVACVPCQHWSSRKGYLGVNRVV